MDDDALLVVYDAEEHFSVCVVICLVKLATSRVCSSTCVHWYCHRLLHSLICSQTVCPLAVNREGRTERRAVDTLDTSAPLLSRRSHFVVDVFGSFGFVSAVFRALGPSRVSIHCQISYSEVEFASHLCDVVRYSERLAGVPSHRALVWIRVNVFVCRGGLT